MATDDNDSNFFSRWSRRKVQVRTGEPVVPEAPAPVAAPVPAARVAAPAAVPAAVDSAAPQTAEVEADAPPMLTLDDVARLTPESDYSAFVARGVPANVRNAAVKKLFTDPHYNVMDGLDIYIDDYSKPSPLSAAEMASMVGARFLKLVDDPDEVKGAKLPKEPALASGNASPDNATEQQAETAEQQAGPDAAGDTLAGDSPVSDTPEHPHDDHADLQLQRDDVPEPPGSGRRTG